MTSTPGRSTAVVWFRRDLRLIDNPAWSAATRQHGEVVALYVLDPVPLDRAGAPRRHQHLAELHELDAALRARGGRLMVRTGRPARVVPAVVAETQATELFINADVSPYSRFRDRAVTRTVGVPLSSCWGNLVHPPGSVHTAAGYVHKVFGSYHRAWTSASTEPWPESGDAGVAADVGDGLPALSAPPRRGAGEAAAQAALERFIDRVDHYPRDRDDLGGPGTSELSVALHFGTISPRHVVDVIGTETEGRAAFVRQLAWRDWYAHLLHEHPQMVRSPLRPALDAIAWSDDLDEIEAWKAGLTGYPLIDAGMRQLAATGEMHNRARMVTASFLVKDLLVDWRVGERHFRELLIDGDLAQNVGNWQWVAGTGPDAAPFFRVFNPVTQSRAHDPHGHYIRRWVPELAGLDDTSIHEPWNAPPLELAAAGVVLGDTYPLPLVDHAEARLRALDAYAEAR